MEQRAKGVTLSDDLLRRVVASSPDCIKVLDLEGNLLAMNEGGQKVLEMADLTPHLGTCWTGWWRGEAEQAAKSAVQQALQGGTGRFEAFAQNFGGTPMWWDVTVSPILGANGKPEQLLSISRDITRRKLAEQEAIELSEQRRLALDSARMGWWHVDVASGRLDMDERFRAIFDVDHASEAYAQVLQRIHPDDRGRVDAAVQAAVRAVDPLPYEVEYRVVHRDGSLRWVAARGQAYHEGEGGGRRAVGMSGTMLDISEQKTAQEDLSASRERFRLLADSMPQMVWSTLPDGFHDYYNARWYEFTGVPFGSTDGEGWNGMFHPDDQERAWATWRHSLATGEPYQIEYRLRYRDGSYRWVLGRALAMRDEHGAIVRWFGTCTDIHEGRLLREQNAQLLESERTARAEAERTSRLKDEFLATLSHELRTPLNAILGWTQVLRGDPGNAEDIEAGLVTIERNARAQNQIIEDLLDMSKIISGKVRLDVQRMDLSVVVAAAIETMRPAAAAKSIRLLPMLDPLVAPISGDPNRLQQVFWNLLSNALKFTPRGGKVQVVVERINSHVEVSISDSGEGIAPEFLPYVFDRFRQQDASTTRKHGGLGLGLAIVKQLVELHGGSVRVESAGSGQGTTFRVALPLSVLRAEPGKPGHETVHPQAGGISLAIPADALNLNGLRVLVVDDEADARGLVRRLLEDRGVTVQTAGSVAEAMRIFAEGQFDVLVSDIGMPEEDGYTLIKRVRGLTVQEGSGTPAIALTAYARAEDRLKIILAGFQMHLAKPVEAAELLAMVASLAGRT